MNGKAGIVHLNITNFAAAVAIAKDTSLSDVPFVVAKADAARATVHAVSMRAWEEGISAGMPLATARRLVRGLITLPPDPRSYDAAHKAMEGVASRYTPVVQNDTGGHLYLDLAGTTALFGPHIDCAIRIRNEIASQTGLEPSVAVASNKLVAKIASRAVRPRGIAYVREGEEASFIAPQDALLLPGIGNVTARIISVAGLREIGELAQLEDNEAIALFGHRGLALRDAARGIDKSKVSAGNLADRTIRRTIDFAEPILDYRAVQAAVTSAMEDLGLELRQASLGTASVGAAVLYADGVRSENHERTGRLLTLDKDLIGAAMRAFHKAAVRRVRIRGIILTASRLEAPLREPDLFAFEGPTRPERVQSAVDTARLRFGVQAVTLASTLFYA